MGGNWRQLYLNNNKKKKKIKKKEMQVNCHIQWIEKLRIRKTLRTLTLEILRNLRGE